VANWKSSFNLYFAIVCVFWLLGNVTLAILRFRGEGKSLIGQLFENFKVRLPTPPHQAPKISQ